MNILLRDVSKVHNTSFTTNDFDADPRDYVQKAVHKYSGNTFIITKNQNEVQEVYVPTAEESKENK